MERLKNWFHTLTLSRSEKTKAMFAAAKVEDLDSVKKMISAGADSLAEDEEIEGGNLLTLLYEKLKVTTRKDEVLELIDYVLNQPRYQELTEKSETVYRTVLLLLAKEFYFNFEIVSKMLKFIFKFKQINQLIFENNINLSWLRGENTKLNPAAFFVYTYIEIYKPYTEMDLVTNKVFKMLRSLKEIGFSTLETPGCITVLTVLIAFLNLNPDIVEEHIEYTLTEFEINLGSCTIYVGNNLVSEKMSTDRYKWHVPDVLFLSCIKHKTNLVKKFLRHWWGPPLALIYFFPHAPNNELSNAYIPHLISYGGIPHGTQMFKCVKSKTLKPLEQAQSLARSALVLGIKDNKVQDVLSTFDSYQQLIAPPMRLTDLAKYAVRQVLAIRAAEPDTNLPMLLKQNLPPLLYTVCTEYLTPDSDE